MRPILLAEHDPGLVRLALDTLLEARLENPVHHADDHRLAMEKMAQFAAAGELPALVLLDLRMPGGYAVLAAIRTRVLWADVPVVAMGGPEGAETRQARDLGARAYILDRGDFEEFARSLEATGRFWATVNYRPADRRPEDLTLTEGLQMQMRVEEAMSAVYFHLSLNPHQPADLKTFWSNASVDEMNHLAILKLERNFVRDLGMDKRLGAALARRLIHQNEVELPRYDVVRASTMGVPEAVTWAVELEMGEVNSLFHLLLRLLPAVRLECLQRLLVDQDQHLQSFQRLAEQHGLSGEIRRCLADLRTRLASESEPA